MTEPSNFAALLAIAVVLCLGFLAYGPHKDHRQTEVYAIRRRGKKRMWIRRY